MNDKTFKIYIFHNAFTMLELVFVIVIIGILAAAIIPNTKTNRLQEAAIQVASHIRYTQHLAMVDDKFDPNDNEWYKSRWQIRFTGGTIASHGEVAYAVFSDFVGLHSGHPEVQELARDPQTNKLITGGVTNGVLYDDDNVFHEANLGLTYGVETISLSSSCKLNGSMRIYFDHLGRPMRGNLSGYSSPYDSNSIIPSRCEITIGASSESVKIAIEPETGYVHILNS